MAMTAILAGTDVTSRCMTLARTEKLNRPWTGEISLAAQYASFTEGVDELVIVDGGTDKAVGPAYYGEDSGDADNVFSTIRCNSPDEFFDRRQVMDPDGDYSDPSIFEDNLNAVDIFAAALTNSIANDGAFGIATGSTAGGGVTLVGSARSTGR